MEKKISFGFSKVVKKPQLVVKPKKEPENDEEKIEIIECLEGQSIKIAGAVDAVPEAPLVIALTANTTPLEKVKQLREEAVAARAEAKGNGQVPDIRNETLEQRAAREFMEDLKQKQEEEESDANFTVPLTSDEIKLGGAKESTMDDYEDVPIANFGLAMLRGMGWKDEEHKAKQKRLEDDMIVCRPKGLGLGADKAMKQQVKLAAASGSTNEKLVMKKGAFVRILAGKQKDFYGQVEGLDDESGRVFVKMALGGGRESVNEAFVQLVTEKEYKDNRKVLNMGRYEEYKNKEATTGRKEKHDSPREESSRSSSSRRDEEHSQKQKHHRDRRSRSRSQEEGRRRESHSKHHRSERHEDKDRDRRRERSRSRSRSRDRRREHKKSHKDGERRRRDR